ncbi:MAG: hypothetical protein QXK06_02055 [Candidatus Diapherotrites archaeon]
MKKALLFAIFLLFFAQVFSLENAASSDSEEETLVFEARIAIEENAVVVDSVQVVYGTPMEIDSDANYVAKILDEQLSVLYQAGFDFEEFTVTLPPEASEEEIEKHYAGPPSAVEKVLFLPYFEEAAVLAIGSRKGELIALIDLQERVCNKDGKCGENENFLSCPADCPLEKKDNYCLPEKDNVCDSDCVEGLDSDCEKGGKEGVKAETFSIEQTYFIAVVVLAFVLIFAYNVLRKKRKQKGKA